MMRAYLVDDEPPALERLCRMLTATGRVEVVGACSDPVDALEGIREAGPDLLFLDIHMPELSGFELLAKLETQPLVIFTTAYDQHAVEAFDVNSIDYLLKPVEPVRLDQALRKAQQLLTPEGRPLDVRAVIAQLASVLQPTPKQVWLTRVASRSGDRIEVIDLRRVTHFAARDKLTFAVTPDREFIVDLTIAELEQQLDPARFVRIHRGVVLNLQHLLDLHADFGGRMTVRLKGPGRTALTVSRDRVRTLKQRLGL
jgi:two-component system, LytTR family, response regulator